MAETKELTAKEKYEQGLKLTPKDRAELVALKIIKLTPEEKLAQGLVLSPDERVQLDAHRITLRRIRENKEEQEQKAALANAPKAPSVELS